jgi:hypothetical protein
VSHLSIRLCPPKQKSFNTKVIRNGEVTYSSKKISNGWVCVINLAKFAQNFILKIDDLRPTKLETDCQNWFISSTHIFFMYCLFLIRNMVVLIWREDMWSSLRESEPNRVHLKLPSNRASEKNAPGPSESADSSIIPGSGSRKCFENRFVQQCE